MSVISLREATAVTNSDVRGFHSRIDMRSVSPRFFDGLQTLSLTLGNIMKAISVHVTIDIYISSLRSFISHYKATLFGCVHVLISQNKTSLLRFCTHTVLSTLEHCTKSQWRYCMHVGPGRYYLCVLEKHDVKIRPK